jgi:hypothetical protein
MTLRFIDFKTNEPHNTEKQPATSPSVVSSWLKNSGSNDSAESNFEGYIRFAQSFFYIDRSTMSLDPEALDGQNTLFDVGRSMFDVRCLFFS